MREEKDNLRDERNEGAEENLPREEGKVRVVNAEELSKIPEPPKGSKPKVDPDWIWGSGSDGGSAGDGGGA